MRSAVESRGSERGVSPFLLLADSHSSAHPAEGTRWERPEGCCLRNILSHYLLLSPGCIRGVVFFCFGGWFILVGFVGLDCI